ncbi:MAG TPA: acyl-CoA thioesterase domain-containing protein [Albitalea sp.]|nr:acyl-CoA thioesterase domain-containing protein [Albitalea sp.]
MAHNTLLPWNGRDIDALLRLQPVSASTFRSRHASPNARNTVFGGQLLGQALMAAAITAPPGRDVTAMQFMFLQSATPDQPVDYEVAPLQDGKRFASRHVRGTQAGHATGKRRIVLDAQVSFAVPMPGPEHAAPSPAGNIDPQTLPRLEDLPAETADAVWRTIGYPFDTIGLDLRVADPERGLGLASSAPALRFWLRTRDALPDDPMLQAAAFAYLSDWWLNFTSVGVHVHELLRDATQLHVASLNHAIWFHRPLRADRWLHFDVHSPSAAQGRGLSIAAVHDAHGVLVASATQQNLMVPAGG